MHLQTRQPSSASRHRHTAADQLHLQRVLHPRSRPCRLKAARPVRASGDSSSTPDASSSSSSSSQGNQPAAATVAAAASSSSSLGDVLSEARQDLQNSLSLLKDAAGTAFVPGYQSSASTSTNSTTSGSSSRSGKPKVSSRRLSTYSSLIAAADEAQDTQPVQSIPARLQRLLSGTFIRQAAGSSSSSRKKAPFDAQLAAIQFELQAQADTAADQQQKQQQVETTSSDVVMDVVPEAAEPPGQQQDQQQQQQQLQVGGATPTSQAAASETAARSATQPAGAASGSAAATATAATADASFLATTQVLVLATWAVFLLQWWPALPELWLTVRKAGVFQALLALMFMFPDTPVTNALCLDLTALQQGSWGGLFTSGLLHSGLADTWLATKALQDSAKWLEAGLGPMPLLATAVITSFCASVAHLVAGTTMIGLSGPGAVMGIYTTWLILVVQHLREDVPIRVIAVKAGLLLLLFLGLGMLQPAVGFASIFGGVIGGGLAVRLAVPVGTAMKWGLALPFLMLLFVLRLGVDAAKVLLLAGLAVVASGVQLVMGLTQSIRRL